MGLDFNNLGISLFQGILIQAAPNILKGAMKELLWNVSLKDFVQLTSSGLNVWDLLDDVQKNAFTEMAQKIGPLDWFTLEWVMEAGREAAPSIYSALLDWGEGRDWLEGQIEDLKIKLAGGT